MKIGKLRTLFVFLIGPCFVFGQESFSKRLIIKYDSLIGMENIGLINGTPHFLDFRSRNSHPFYGSINWQEGEITYKGQTYPKTLIKYDTYKQVLVLGVEKQKGRLTPIQLQDVGISSFKIDQVLFVNIQNGGVHEVNNFHEVLFEGEKLSLLARRMKSDEVEEKTLTVEFQEDSKFYIYQDQQLIEFKGKGTFYSLFPEQKSSIKAFIKKNDLKIKAKSLDSVVKLASYCDQF